MAEQVSAEDLKEFLNSLRRTIERAASVYDASDLVGLDVKGDLTNTQEYLSPYRCHRIGVDRRSV